MIKQELKYIECDKQGYHYGEALNMLCLEQGCLDKALCCGACVEQSHKGHNTKPLKLVLLETKEHAGKIQPVKINTSNIMELLEKGKKDALAKLNEFKQRVNTSINDIQKSILNWYTSVVDQINIKTSNSKDGIDQLFESVYTDESISKLLATIQKIIALIPKSDQSDESIKETQIMEAIILIQADTNKTLAKISKEILTKLEVTSTELTVLLAEKNIWNMEKYKFSAKFKHPQIVIINPYTVKASASQTYKFAVMQQEIKKYDSGSKIAFKVNTNCSWLAFGVCHKNIVQSKNYSFLYSSIGHGGYLVSSNGGSWSNSQAQYNNFVKAFKFGKDNIITVAVDYETHKVKFKKHGTNDAYELDFVEKPDDPLHPCVLFYYPNDQVEFLQDFKQ